MKGYYYILWSNNRKSGFCSGINIAFPHHKRYNKAKYNQYGGGQVETYDTSIWQQALARQKAKREDTRKALLEHAVSTLVSYFSGKEVQAVYLCGSILNPRAFQDDSDLDIAVCGLQGNMLRIAAELEALLDWEIDLIELEHCRFREKIEQEGMRIR